MTVQLQKYLGLAALLLAGTFALGCADDGEDDGFENTYNNHVELTCNGEVIVHETFTTLESCEAFRDSNTFMCSGIELTVNC